MANVDKATVRNEVNRLKTDFEKLRAQGKVSSEVGMLMNSMLMIIELMLSIFLERKTKKSGANSSIPSSQTDKDDTSTTSSGAKGKGKQDKSGAAHNTRTVETVTRVEVAQCDVCGEPLTNTPCHHIERRTKIDIVFEKTVTHVDAEVKQCPVCDSTVKGFFPDDMPGQLQYGDGLKAFVINLLVSQMVAVNRVQKLVKSMIGTVIAESTLLKFVLRLHQALEGWEQQTVEQLLSSPSLHVDETSLRVDQKNHWIHVYSSEEITLKFLHRKRGKEAIEAVDIIPRYGGTIIHDSWSSYLSYEHCGHGLCGSHLLRELTFIVDAHDDKWAANMKQLLQQTCALVAKRKRKKLTEKEYANLQKRYRNILTRAEKELPEIPPKPSGKRGRIAKSDAHNLHERLRRYEAAVLCFARESQVAFTNNRAERDLRMAKVKQKVSGCFRSVEFAQAYCRISSYLQTMSYKGINPLIAIQMALAGQYDE